MTQSMTQSTISATAQFSDDQVVWESLKEAIAASSGFQRWQKQPGTDQAILACPLDQQVRRYLRETLETLAY